MKRYIDEKTGKIVNILEKDESNKIVKILIDYFFVEGAVPTGRLNLVSFLRDFIKLGDIEDLNKIVEYIGEYKKTLKLTKEDEDDFEVLYKFFRMYKDLEEAKLGIEDATNYISEMTDKKDELAKKDKKEMTKKDKILKVFFDNGFEFKRLAKVACEAWENHIKEEMNNGKKEVYITLEQEIAYQDLLEFATCDSVEVPKKENIVVEVDKKPVENKEENKKEENVEKTSKIDINVQVPERKEPVKIEIETEKEEIKPEIKVENVEKKDQKVHSIHINTLGDDDLIVGNHDSSQSENKPKIVEGDPQKITQKEINSLLGLDDNLGNNANSSNQQKVPEVKKIENDEKNKRDSGYTSNIHIFVPGVDDEKQSNIINPSEVKKATENIDLKESVDFFNNVLDDRMSRKSLLNDDDDMDGFRD